MPGPNGSLLLLKVETEGKMPPFVIIDAPSILGLRPSGVEELPEALKAAGLQAGLNAEYAGRVEPPPYDAKARS